MMEKPHLEFLVEEPSMEAFLHELLPRLFRLQPLSQLCEVPRRSH